MHLAADPDEVLELYYYLRIISSALPRIVPLLTILLIASGLPSLVYVPLR